MVYQVLQVRSQSFAEFNSKLHPRTMSVPKIWFLVPDFDFPADGPLVLGTIINHPLQPNRIINEDSIAAVPASSKRITHKEDWKHTVEIERDGRIGVLARFLSGLLGEGLGGDFDERTINEYDIKNLETAHFSPTESYVNDAVGAVDVQDFLKGSRFKLPVYMITGLKIARGGSSQVLIKKRQMRGLHANTTFLGMPTGAQVEVDTGNIALRQTRNEESSFKSSNFVIAYRLNKITFQKVAGQGPNVKQEGFVKGAMLGLENRKVEAEHWLETRYAVIQGEEGLVKELPPSALTPAFDEENNEDCQCILVPLSK
jgi:hypothetical protein